MARSVSQREEKGAKKEVGDVGEHGDGGIGTP
jgi:hypothetical protein